MLEERYLTEEETETVVEKLKDMFGQVKQNLNFVREEEIQIGIGNKDKEIFIWFFDPKLDNQKGWFGNKFWCKTTIFKDICKRFEEILELQCLEDSRNYITHITPIDVSNAKKIIRGYIELYQKECDEMFAKKIIG